MTTPRYIFHGKGKPLSTLDRLTTIKKGRGLGIPDADLAGALRMTADELAEFVESHQAEYDSLH